MMAVAGAVAAVLVVGIPAALLAGALGWFGVGVLWTAWANLIWPALGAALFLVVTNSDNVAERLDAPVLTGLMLGATLSAFSAPLWLGGFWAGRRAGQARTR